MEKSNRFKKILFLKNKNCYNVFNRCYITDNDLILYSLNLVIYIIQLLKITFRSLIILVTVTKINLWLYEKIIKV